MITLATEKLFGHGQEDDVSVMAQRSFKLPGKIAGSGGTEALAFADESSGWSGWPGLRCMMLRCGAGIRTKRYAHHRFSRYI